MKKRLSDRTLREGVRYLTERDKYLAIIVSAYGPPPLWEREQGFHTLIRIILEQQVSLRSAKAAYDRLEAALHTITPDGFLRLTDHKLKRIGFSRQKILYGRELSGAIIEGRLDLSQVARLEDEKAKVELMKVKGIGPWTADIYLLMALRRPDIWPRGDLALELAWQRVNEWVKRPTAEALRAMSDEWRPWRAVAARILWHFYLSEGKKEAAPNDPFNRRKNQRG